jgi:ATP-binding cassette, subfamily B, bacterial PglK
MIQVYKKLYGLLDRRERRNAAILLGLLVLVAFVEALGVASIAPFVAVLANPELIETNPYLAGARERLGGPPPETFVVLLGLAFFVMLIISLALRALGVWARVRFVHNRNYHWSTRLFHSYLRQPYDWFLSRHTSGLSTRVLSETQQVAGQALMPAAHIVAHLLLIAFLIGLLIVVDPVLALATLILIGGGFIGMALAVKNRLEVIGVERQVANCKRFTVAQEAFGGVKEVKVKGLEARFVQRFQKPAQVMASRNIMAGLLSEVPPIGMQGLLFGGMLLALVYLIAARGSVNESLPVIAVFGLAGVRLLPAVMALYRESTVLRFNLPALDALSEDLKQMRESGHDAGYGGTGRPNRLRLRSQLSLDNISYSYPGAVGPALKNLTMEIPAYSTVGLVGTTGAGKTTLVDIVLGLLRPQSGYLKVDDDTVTDVNLRSWQRSVGYVPQQIFLADDSVAGNIAFGSTEQEIDLEAVERAARIASLHDFVVNELPQGYQTHVGERGVRLSGGQRQRIGIARALYHDPDILILDEATSALDNLTEKAVMDAVHLLSRQKTIILIAHRLSTVKACDQIYLLDGGRVAAQGRFDELVSQSELFRTMAKTA